MDLAELRTKVQKCLDEHSKDMAFQDLRSKVFITEAGGGPSRIMITGQSLSTAKWRLVITPIGQGRIHSSALPMEAISLQKVAG